MSWVKLDDGFAEHDKVDRLSDRSFRLHITAMCYAARNLTDGRLDEKALKLCSLISHIARPARNIEELVTLGVWHAPGEFCDSEECVAPDDESWVIHDYLQCNKSRAEVKDDREKNRRRQREYRESLRNAGSNDNSNALRNGASNEAPTRPDPLTTKPSAFGEAGRTAQELRKRSAA